MPPIHHLHLHAIMRGRGHGRARDGWRQQDRQRREHREELLNGPDGAARAHQSVRLT